MKNIKYPIVTIIVVIILSINVISLIVNNAHTIMFYKDKENIMKPGEYIGEELDILTTDDRIELYLLTNGSVNLYIVDIHDIEFEWNGDIEEISEVNLSEPSFILKNQTEIKTDIKIKQDFCALIIENPNNHSISIEYNIKIKYITESSWFLWKTLSLILLIVLLTIFIKIYKINKRRVKQNKEGTVISNFLFDIHYGERYKIGWSLLIIFLILLLGGIGRTFIYIFELNKNDIIDRVFSIIMGLGSLYILVYIIFITVSMIHLNVNCIQQRKRNQRQSPPFS